MTRRRRPRDVSTLEIEALGTALGPRVRLTVEGVPIVMTAPEAYRTAQAIWDAAELCELDDITEGPPNA